MGHDYPVTKINGVTKTIHRLIAKELIGRPLRKYEQVHHKDKNRKNYSKDNLEITTIKQHRLLHHPILKIKCYECGKLKKISEKRYKWKLAHGQKNFYCSRKCTLKNTLSHYKTELDIILTKGLKEGKTIYKIAQENSSLNKVTLYNHYKKNIIRMNIPINSIQIRRFKNGLFWCNKCKNYLSKTFFSKNSHKSYGISSYCKNCRRKFKC